MYLECNRSDKKMVKIKEISIMIYRKFTKDFDSLGFRLGIAVEVGNDNPKDSWVQGRLFLEGKVIAEEAIIEKKFELLKRQKKGIEGSEVKVEPKYELIPVEPMARARKESVYKEVKGGHTAKVEKNAYEAVDIDDALLRIEFETGITVEVLKQMVKEKMEELKGMLNERGATFIVGKELGVDLKI